MAKRKDTFLTNIDGTSSTKQEGRAGTSLPQRLKDKEGNQIRKKVEEAFPAYYLIHRACCRVRRQQVFPIQRQETRHGQGHPAIDVVGRSTLLCATLESTRVHVLNEP